MSTTRRGKREEFAHKLDISIRQRLARLADRNPSNVLIENSPRRFEPFPVDIDIHPTLEGFQFVHHFAELALPEPPIL